MLQRGTKAGDELVRSLMPSEPGEPDHLAALAAEADVDLQQDVRLELLNHSAVSSGQPLALWDWSKLLGLTRVGER